MRVMNGPMLAATVVALSQTTNAVKLDHLVCGDITASITGSNPANKAFTSAAVDATANTVAIASHGYLTGIKVTLTTDDALPGGLAVLTDYYLIVVSAGVIKFAASQADALAGTAIDLIDAGTGNHNVVVTAALAGSVKLQKNDEPEGSTAIWQDVDSSSKNFAAAATLNWTLTDVGYREIRAVVAVTSGTVTAAIRINMKGV